MTDHTFEPIEKFRADMDERRSWHLSKEFPITLIATIIIQTVSVSWFFADMRKDIELLKADTAVLHQRDSQTNQLLNESMEIIRGQFQRLDTKLDRLIEQRYKAQP